MTLVALKNNHSSEDEPAGSSGSSSSRSKQKDSEHESGYYEDGSDFEEQRRRTTTASGKLQSGESSSWSSTSIAKGINELDLVRDSPASPEPDDDDDDDADARCSECHEGEMIIHAYITFRVALSDVRVRWV